MFDKGSELEDTEHLLLLEHQGKVVGEQLDLERLRELLLYLKVEKVQQF